MNKQEIVIILLLQEIIMSPNLIIKLSYYHQIEN